MIEIDPEAALEILETQEYFASVRTGLGDRFLKAAEAMLDAIEEHPQRFPAHPFASTPGTKRVLFPPPWPLAFAYIVLPSGPYVLACEHLKRNPLYWRRRLRPFES